MSEPTPKPTRPRRRWTSISLRGLMLLVLIVGGLMGWRARRASLQRRAVARIAAAQGSVTYDWEYAGNGFTGKKPSGSPPGPTWLRKAIGDEYFQDVAVVILPYQLPPPPDLVEHPAGETDEAYIASFCKPMLEDQLACLDGLDRIEGLELRLDYLTPEGWARLSRQVRLKDLNLEIDTIGAEGRAALERLTELEALSIHVKHAEIGDLAFLDRLPNLRLLHTLGFPVTNAGLAAISRHDQLQLLDISAPDLTDAGMVQITGLKELRRLRIYSASRVTDAGLADMERLGELWEINLPGTPLTDVGLGHLRKLPKLSLAYFCGDRISRQAIEKLKAEQPELDVRFDPCASGEPTPVVPVPPLPQDPPLP